MRILFLHPEDSPRRGPWSRQRWDLIVDLGRSSRYSEEIWSELSGCAILRSDSFREGAADVKRIRQILSAGTDRLIDKEGIDWWNLVSLLWLPEALQLLAFERVAAEIDSSAELWSTRPGWPATAMAALLGRSLRSFGTGLLAKFAARAGHYTGVMHRFTAAQIKEIFLDKYDSGYRWRARVAPRPKRCPDAVVLLPSAYGNVSRMAADYARLLPQQSFLMVATRQSARRFTPPSNVEIRDLASYADVYSSDAEASSLTDRWQRLRAGLDSSPELQTFFECGVFESFASLLRNGLSARDAWRGVLEREPVCGVLCGDDSNVFTRLPVLLAARRRIPTADFHHGAFDGHYLFKTLPCDVYLAKSEIEHDYLLRVCGLARDKIVIAAPSSIALAQCRDQSERQSLVLFSEPYEAVGMRGEEVYRELLPQLLQLAKENGRRLVIKLHPFESRSQRKRLVRQVLGENEARFIAVLDGPLTADLLAQTWCGITVESTTVMDCWRNGICCFLCDWLTLSSYEYAQQFGRFGIGEILHSPKQIAEIPEKLADFQNRTASASILQASADPQMLHRWLTSGFREYCDARSTS